MQIISLNKSSLIDYPGRIVAVIFLHSCNFRCGYCHNPELVIKKPNKIISDKEVLDLLSKRKKYLDGVCISGGEPLINKDINGLCRKIKNLGYKIKIDTNGSFPLKLKELIDENLVDYIALDIKADKKNYNKVCRANVELRKIENSIKIIINSGVEHEFRTTVIKGIHNEKIIENIGRFLNSFGKKPKNYFIQNFIPREGKLIDKEMESIQIFTNDELNKLKDAAQDYFDDIEVRS